MVLETETAIYFYKAQDARFGFLSNFYRSEFQDERGDTYKWSEQYFMKQKQELFDPDNEKMALAILEAKSPPEVKRLGRKVQNYDDDVWNEHRFDCMLEALKLKFSGNPELEQALLATGDKQLYEASHRDAVWGIGLSVAAVTKMLQENEAFGAAGDVDAKTQEACYGQNLLGKALMACRTWLRAKNQADTLQAGDP